MKENSCKSYGRHWLLGLIITLAFISIIATISTGQAFALALNEKDLNEKSEIELEDKISKFAVYEEKIENGKRKTVKNLQDYKKQLDQDALLTDTEKADAMLLKIGYNENDISYLDDAYKAEILKTDEIIVENSIMSTGTNVGLSLTVSYSLITLELPQYLYYPVDFYVVNTYWSWANPDCTGGPDYISINLDQSYNHYQLLNLTPDSALAAYEYCNFSYTERIYNGSFVDIVPNIKGQRGQVNASATLKSRSIALKMPKNIIEYEQPGDPFIHKTIYTDFKGNCQFILQINQMPQDSGSQLVGITYGHSVIEYNATYSESNTVSLGVDVSVEGPSLGLGFDNTSGWSYTEYNSIQSTSILYNLSYEKMRLINGKVYNIVNLAADRALEYAQIQDM